ncbi:agmatine deiminase family protein, partial [Candidatus Pacearchaeota archaeon]|nr:agmatine deiminase family protein [Candidatus Pacearchaeota archaeon]
DNGKRLAASYANFYIANDIVLLPVFGNKRNDREARYTLEHLFPDRKVIPINCLPLIKSGGTIHCITQQQPKSL